MADAKYKEYLKSPEWAEMKLDLIQSRGCKCEGCGRPRSVSGLQVHHKTYARIFNELPSDLVLLCGPCHQKEHGLPVKRKDKPKGHKPKYKKKRKPKLTPMQKILANHKAGKYKTLVHFNNALERMKKKFRKDGTPRKRWEIK